MENLFDLYLVWLSYWLTWTQYPIDMGEVKGQRNDLNEQKKRIDRLEQITYGCYL